MIVDFSVDTELTHEMDSVVELMGHLKRALSKLAPAGAPPLPGPRADADTVAKPAKAKATRKPETAADTRQIEMPGTRTDVAHSATYTAKHVQDVTRALMNTPNGMAEAARLLGSVGALKVSEIKAERVSEYVESVQKALDKAGSAS